METLAFLLEKVFKCFGRGQYDSNIEEQELIILHFWHFGENVDKGILDPKFGLVKACLKWQAPSVSSFIEYCLTIKDSRISSLLKKIGTKEV